MAENKKVTIDVEDDHHLWAICRAMYEQAVKEMASPDFDCWPEEPKPPASAPLVERIDWASFTFFCMGFIKGLEVLTQSEKAKEDITA